MKPLRITGVRATTVTVPLAAPLRHAAGAHWGRFVRTIVEVDTDQGTSGARRDGRRRRRRRGRHHELDAVLGGKLRDAVPFASYIFFRYADSERLGEVRATDQLLAHARALKQQYGFTAHKLTGGVFPPAYSLACYRALADALPGDRLRYDPNCALSLEEAIRFGKGIRHYRAFDVVLLDTTFWGGIRACIKAAGVSETFQLGVAVHSSGELGIQLATMLHRGAVLPNLTYAANAHYHHLVDDIIAGGKLAYRNGAIAVPDRAGLGISLDRDKLEQYATLYRRLGGYLYDRDSGRPDWYPMVPSQNWAGPADERPPPRMTT